MSTSSWMTKSRCSKFDVDAVSYNIVSILISEIIIHGKLALCKYRMQGSKHAAKHLCTVLRASDQIICSMLMQKVCTEFLIYENRNRKHCTCWEKKLGKVKQQVLFNGKYSVQTAGSCELSTKLKIKALK